MIPESKCRSMHNLYQELTDLSLPWVSTYLWPWEMFCLRFTDEDLRMVIQFIKNQKRQGRPHRNFTFRNFISGPASLDYFAEDLAQAKAEARRPVRTNRDKVLEQAGRPEPVRHTAMPVAAVMKEHKKMAELLRAFKESL